jgi:restriction system protein
VSRSLGFLIQLALVTVTLLALFGWQWTFAITLLVIAVYAFNLIKNWQESRVRCQHGVRGGLTRNKCLQCADDKVNEERERLEAQAQRAERERIQEAALALETSERERLSRLRLNKLQTLLDLTPQAFEDAIAQLFRDSGYSVEQTPYSNDFGRDAIATKDGEKVLIECKRYEPSRAVGRPALQNFHSAIVTDKAARGFFVTTGRFTAAALQFARANSIELFDGTRLLELIASVYPLTGDETRVKVMCCECGEVMEHDLTSGPRSHLCSKGHRTELRQDAYSLTPTPLIPSCPRCNKPMKLVAGKRGTFWGCSAYPTCRGTRPHPENREKVVGITAAR